MGLFLMLRVGLSSCQAPTVRRTLRRMGREQSSRIPLGTVAGPSGLLVGCDLTENRV